MADRRRRCPLPLRPVILQRQRYRCLYCSIPFGSVLRRGARQIITAPVWDHRMPYAYLGKNPKPNWRAACATCNGIKSDLVFINDLALRAHILGRRREKGIYLAWVPPVSSEEDPYGWSVAFARWMTEQIRPRGESPQHVIRKDGARIVFEDDEAPIDDQPTPPRPARDDISEGRWFEDES